MNKLEENIRRGRDFLLCKRFPIICGAMTWVSDAKLVSAICNAGCFGVLASGSMEVHHLQNEIIKTKTLTNESFGVNLITMHPRLLQMIDVCLDNNIQYIDNENIKIDMTKSVILFNDYKTKYGTDGKQIIQDDVI